MTLSGITTLPDNDVQFSNAKPAMLVTALPKETDVNVFAVLRLELVIVEFVLVDEVPSE